MKQGTPYQYSIKGLNNVPLSEVPFFPTSNSSQVYFSYLTDKFCWTVNSHKQAILFCWFMSNSLCLVFWVKKLKSKDALNSGGSKFLSRFINYLFYNFV